MVMRGDHTSRLMMPTNDHLCRRWLAKVLLLCVLRGDGLEDGVTATQLHPLHRRRHSGLLGGLRGLRGCLPIQGRPVIVLIAVKWIRPVADDTVDRFDDVRRAVIKVGGRRRRG